MTESDHGSQPPSSANGKEGANGKERSDFEKGLWGALATVTFPGMSRDVVSFGFVKKVTAEPDGSVAVELEVPTHNPGSGEAIRTEVERVLTELEGVREAKVGLRVVTPRTQAPPAQRGVMNDPSLLEGVRSVVAVASGKGGVGKSTVSVNLAVQLAQAGHRVGLLDCDIYGPSIPTMLGITDRPAVARKKLVPFEKYGVRSMSLGFVVEQDTPVIWRGPMVQKAIEQLLGDVLWGELDQLIIDLPPGTGDAQLTLAQKVPLSGAVIVSTPQDVALIDARKGLAMFEKVKVPVLGFVENMSYFECPSCGDRTDVFKHGGAERAARELGVRFLGAIPLDSAVVHGGDDGVPVVAADPEGSFAQAFSEIAGGVVEALKEERRARPLTIL